MTGLIILAAGASSRLGAPKQQLLYKGKTLLQHCIETALSTHCTPVIVVLGAHAVVILPEIPSEQVTIVENPDWEEGMASSIRAGITALRQKAPEVSNVILMLCDQPFVDTTLLNNLVQKKLETGKGIVASYYNDTMGVPVLFDKAFFPGLLSLKGQEGAKKLLFQYEQEVVAVPFPLGGVDIDTQEDYSALKD